MRDIQPALNHLWRTENGMLHLTFGEIKVGNLCVIPHSIADLDYLGTFALLQVWDYSEPAEWRYGIWQSYHVGSQWPDNFDRGWFVRWDEWDKLPSHETFGVVVDTWAKAPEAIRFLLV